MKQEVERFYYQPDFTNHIVNWLWTFFILIVAIIFWLEVTVFNWITGVLFALFFVVITVQFASRTIEIIGNNLIINKVFKSNFSVLNMKKIKIVKKTKHSITFKYGHKMQKFYFSKKSANRLYDILKER